MALVNNDIYKLYEKLEYNFLYKNDLNSIHILLNLYDLDKDIRNIYPNYISINMLRDRIIDLYNYREDNQFLASCVTSVVHEDINRLELYICLEGYKKGYFNRCLANRLENITIKYIPINKLYESELLHHYYTNIYEVYEMKTNLYKDLEKEKENERIYNLIEVYYSKMIKPKINLMNKFILKEVDYDNITLNENELEDLNKESYDVLVENIGKLYRESFWYGLNDRVLKRYR